MKRVPLTFLVFAMTGGCMALQPDLIDEAPVSPSRHTSTQAQAWSSVPSSVKAAPKGNDKSESKIIKTAYSESKAAQEESLPISLGMLRLMNNKRITFHYEADDIRATSAANLEIWGTTDMRNWRKYETVAQTSSSLAVEVKDEGLYGFTMIARGTNEAAKSQPPAGEPPQVWVAVDLTKPFVQLLDTELNVHAAAPVVIVRWSAKDRSFGPQPMTVLYAERPEGPWRPLAANLENSGRCEACLPPHLTGKLYLRVQAADMMGNFGQSQTTELRLPNRPSLDASRASHSAVSILAVDGR